MSRKLIYLGMIVGGWVGWWAGGAIGLGLMGTFLTSTVGSFGGVYLAWWITRDFLE